MAAAGVPHTVAAPFPGSAAAALSAQAAAAAAMTGSPLQQHPTSAYHALSQHLAVQQQLNAAQQLSHVVTSTAQPAAQVAMPVPEAKPLGSGMPAKAMTSVASTSSSGPSQSPSGAKKFRPAYARASSKSQRYIPKPIPQELGNLKVYSKFITSLLFMTDLERFPIFSLSFFISHRFLSSAFGIESLNFIWDSVGVESS